MSRILKKILIFLFRLMPLRDDIILESHPDMSDNSFALYQYFLRQGVNRRQRIHWAIYDKSRTFPDLPENVDIFYLNAEGFGQMVRRFFALYRSRYIFDSNAYIKVRRRGQVRIHLGHGMPIKITPGYHEAEKIGACAGYLVTGEFWKDVFVKKVGLPRDCLLPFGLPRNDVLAAGREKKNYIMFLPTYRQHRLHMENAMTNRFPYGMPEVGTKEELRQLDELLGNLGMTLLFRPHPVQELSVFTREDLDNIEIADDDFLRDRGITLYECLAEAAALITDYSSVYFDFLLTDRPIGLTIGDRDEYFRHYDSPFSDLKKEIRGCHIESFRELEDFICRVARGSRQVEELREMKGRYHQVTDGTSSERLYCYLRDRYGFDKP